MNLSYVRLNLGFTETRRLNKSHTYRPAFWQQVDGVTMKTLNRNPNTH